MLQYIVPTLILLQYSTRFCYGGFLNVKGRRGKSITLAFPENNFRRIKNEISQRALVQLKSSENDDQEDTRIDSIFDMMTDSLIQSDDRDDLMGMQRNSLYGEEELRNILQTHSEISGELDLEGGDISERNSMFSLHDMVMQATDGQSFSEKKKDSSNQLVPKPNGSLSEKGMNDPEIESLKIQIRAIVSDIDGTILSRKQTVHPCTRLAIKRAIHIVQNENKNANEIDFFFLATGKSRKGALDSLGIELGGLLSAMPGVFLQGLFCVDGNGNVVYEKKLSSDAVATAESLACEHQLSIVAYDGDNLYTTKVSDIVRNLHEHYGEPMPTTLPVLHEGCVPKLVEHVPGFHKILFLCDDTKKLGALRNVLEEKALKSNSCVTQALPTMLEWLPTGCSKGLGVEMLCNTLDIDPSTELLALGDAENDVGMLKLAFVGIAMGNGSKKAKDAANYIMDETNDEGGAGIAIERFLLNASNDVVQFT